MRDSPSFLLSSAAFPAFSKQAGVARRRVNRKNERASVDDVRDRLCVFLRPLERSRLLGLPSRSPSLFPPEAAASQRLSTRSLAPSSSFYFFFSYFPPPSLSLSLSIFHENFDPAARGFISVTRTSRRGHRRLCIVHLQELGDEKGIFTSMFYFIDQDLSVLREVESRYPDNPDLNLYRFSVSLSLSLTRLIRFRRPIISFSDLRLDFRSPQRSVPRDVKNAAGRRRLFDNREYSD